MLSRSESVSAALILAYNGRRKLLSAAEELGWPMPVVYVQAKSESRGTFELAFANLMRLQTMCVINHSLVGFYDVSQRQDVECDFERCCRCECIT